jgi:hypothetical protein
MYVCRAVPLYSGKQKLLQLRQQGQSLLLPPLIWCLVVQRG